MSLLLLLFSCLKVSMNESTEVPVYTYKILATFDHSASSYT